jgi:catechol-2,3-dioxygenase
LGPSTMNEVRMSDEKRPDVWIGHVRMTTSALDESEAFMKEIGLRSIFRGEEIAVMELRGGTHIVLAQDKDNAPDKAPFDFMVEDLSATHTQYVERGYSVSDIEEGRIHSSFVVTEPGGNQIVVNSSHVPDHNLV